MPNVLRSNCSGSPPAEAHRCASSSVVGQENDRMRGCPSPSFRPFCGKSTPKFPLVFSTGGNIDEWSLAPNSSRGGSCIGRRFMLVFDPSIKFDEVPAVLKYSFGVGNPPPDDEGRCVFLEERFRFDVAEPPVPSSRPDRFRSRFWRLKWLATGRPVVGEIFGRGNTRE